MAKSKIKPNLPMEMPLIKFDSYNPHRVEVFNYKKQSFDVWYKGLNHGEAFFLVDFILRLCNSFIVKVVHTSKKRDFVTFYHEV